jgi:hypothetical protein
VRAGQEIASITVSGTEYLTLSDFKRFDDGSGYVATLVASAGGFECRPRSFYFDSLDSFIAQLRTAYQSLSGRVEFGNPYEPDHLSFTFGPHGHIVLSGDLGRADASQCRLMFSLRFDQTYIGSFLDQLEKVSRALHG